MSSHFPFIDIPGDILDPHFHDTALLLVGLFALFMVIRYGRVPICWHLPHIF